MNRITNFRGLRIMFLPVLIMTVSLFFSCGEEKEPVFEYGKATIAIEQQSSSTISGFTVLFTPSENAASFFYAIGTCDQADLFENGELNVVTVEGNEPVSVIFEDLESGAEYAVFAKAYDEDGLAGSTAMYRVSTADGSFNIVSTFVGDNNAGVIVNYSSSKFASIEYYLGSPADYNDFVNGHVETVTFETALSGMTVVNYLEGLTPEHTYTVYCKAVGLKGEMEIRTLDFTTMADGTNADVEFACDADVYKGIYTFTPNEHCGTMDVLLSKRGQFLNPDNDDIVERMATWAEIGFNVKRITGESYTEEYVTSNLKGGQQLEAWVVCYDKDMNPQAVRYFPITTPEGDKNAPDCTVKVEVSNVTANGATITYTPDENTKFFIYEIVRGWWYDAQNPNFDLWSYMDMNVNLPPITVYVKELENGKFVFTETGCEPGKKYYAAAFPMNERGYYGRQTPVLVPFETKAE